MPFRARGLTGSVPQSAGEGVTSLICDKKKPWALPERLAILRPHRGGSSDSASVDRAGCSARGAHGAGRAARCAAHTTAHRQDVSHIH